VLGVITYPCGARSNVTVRCQEINVTVRVTGRYMPLHAVTGRYWLLLTLLAVTDVTCGVDVTDVTCGVTGGCVTGVYNGA